MMAGVVPLSDDRYYVLLIANTAGTGWKLPNGEWEWDEATAQEAAKRLGWELAGIVCDIKYDLGLISGTYKASSDQPQSYQFFEAVVAKQDSIWPEAHKRERRWFLHSDACRALADRPECLGALDRCTMHRDNQMVSSSSQSLGNWADSHNQMVSPTSQSLGNWADSHNNEGPKNNVKSSVEDKQVRVVSAEVKEVGKTIRRLYKLNSDPLIQFDLPKELVTFIEEQLEPDCDLGLVPTVTGTPSRAFAATVRQYLDFRWPSSPLDIVDILHRARNSQTRLGKPLPSCPLGALLFPFVKVIHEY
jgi:diphosphoinositol-polyphosphate diphosphatase